MPLSLSAKNADSGFQRLATLPNAFANAQSAYGNQAVLRMLDHSFNSSGPVLQRKFLGHRTKSQPSPSEETVGEHPVDSGSNSGGSGTCINGGARSVCDDNGVYKMEWNSNTCCTKDCTARHEAEHKKDQDDRGCCKAYGIALNKPGANKSEINRQYFAWRTAISPIIECHAYSVGVTCAEELAITNDCAGTGKDTDCCKDIEDFKSASAEQAKTNCAAASGEVPCPNF